MFQVQNRGPGFENLGGVSPSTWSWVIFLVRFSLPCTHKTSDSMKEVLARVILVNGYVIKINESLSMETEVGYFTSFAFTNTYS